MNKAKKIKKLTAPCILIVKGCLSTLTCLLAVAAGCLAEIGITVWSAVETDHQVLLVSPMQPPDKSCWISIVLVSRSRGHAV
jgi:hypothetical protein